MAAHMTLGDFIDINEGIWGGGLDVNFFELIDINEKCGVFSNCSIFLGFHGGTRR